MKKFLIDDLNISTYADVADECPLWSAPFGLKLLDRIDYRKNITALDLGFGTGFPLTEIALRLGETSKVYGIEPWKEASCRAQKKINYYNIKNITILEAKAEAIPLENNSVDLITSNNCINNVQDADKVLNECSRILKPGGQFIQTFNLDTTMHEFYYQLEEILAELKMESEIINMQRHIYEKRMPVPEMLRKMSRNGFTISDIEHDQFNYRFADGSAMLNHYFIRLAFMDSWMKLLPADRAEEIFSKIEARLNILSARSGGMKLSVPFILINACK